MALLHASSEWSANFRKPLGHYFEAQIDLHRAKHNDMDLRHTSKICIESDSILIYILGSKISTSANDVNSGTNWLKIKLYSSFRQAQGNK